MTRTKGWCSPKPYKCRAAHYVGPSGVVALCGATIRTHVPSKKHPREVCDWCQSKARKARAG